ncbi:MAG: hypothetical protein Q7R40_02940 [Phaeospirillum sp.]|nr:hypothetical protein [Phaeospirillum sp.]
MYQASWHIGHFSDFAQKRAGGDVDIADSSMIGFKYRHPTIWKFPGENPMDRDGEKCKTLRIMRQRPALAGNDHIDIQKRAINSMLDCPKRRQCEDRALCTITCAALLGELSKKESGTQS